MKNLLSLILAAATFGLSAQNYTNCAGSSENLQQWLSAGTPVLVASKGVDCSICMSQAPQLGTFASNNPQVRVWAAMTYKYSNQDPSCTQVNQWSSSYGWADLFAFSDATKAFKGSYSPRYQVYAPNGSLAYEGPSLDAASSTALGLVSGIGIGENAVLHFSVHRGPSSLDIVGIEAGQTVAYELIDLAGRSLMRGTLTDANAAISVQGLRSGIHLLKLGNEAHKVLL